MAVKGVRQGDLYVSEAQRAKASNLQKDVARKILQSERVVAVRLWNVSDIQANEGKLSGSFVEGKGVILYTLGRYMFILTSEDLAKKINSLGSQHVRGKIVGDKKDVDHVGLLKVRGYDHLYKLSIDRKGSNFAYKGDQKGEFTTLGTKEALDLLN